MGKFVLFFSLWILYLSANNLYRVRAGSDGQQSEPVTKPANSPKRGITQNERRGSTGSQHKQHGAESHISSVANAGQHHHSGDHRVHKDGSNISQFGNSAGEDIFHVGNMEYQEDDEIVHFYRSARAKIIEPNSSLHKWIELYKTKREVSTEWYELHPLNAFVLEMDSRKIQSNTRHTHSIEDARELVIDFAELNEKVCYCIQHHKIRIPPVSHDDSMLHVNIRDMEQKHEKFNDSRKAARECFEFYRKAVPNLREEINKIRLAISKNDHHDLREFGTLVTSLKNKFLEWKESIGELDSFYKTFEEAESAKWVAIPEIFTKTEKEKVKRLGENQEWIYDFTEFLSSSYLVRCSALSVWESFTVMNRLFLDERMTKFTDRELKDLVASAHKLLLAFIGTMNVFSWHTDADFGKLDTLFENLDSPLRDDRLKSVNAEVESIQDKFNPMWNGFVSSTDEWFEEHSKTAAKIEEVCEKMKKLPKDDIAGVKAELKSIKGSIGGLHEVIQQWMEYVQQWKVQIDEMDAFYKHTIHKMLAILREAHVERNATS